MRLATVNPRIDFNIDSILAPDVSLLLVYLLNSFCLSLVCKCMRSGVELVSYILFSATRLNRLVYFLFSNSGVGY